MDFTLHLTPDEIRLLRALADGRLDEFMPRVTAGDACSVIASKDEVQAAHDVLTSVSLADLSARSRDTASALISRLKSHLPG